MTDYFSLGPVTMNMCINFGANFKRARGRSRNRKWIFLRFRTGHSKYAEYVLYSLYFLSRICSYTFKLRTIVRSFSQYIRRAFVLEYSSQVSGLLAPRDYKSLRYFSPWPNALNHYESSVAEHVRSNQSFIDTKLGTLTQVYFSTFLLN